MMSRRRKFGEEDLRDPVEMDQSGVRLHYVVYYGTEMKMRLRKWIWRTVERGEDLNLGYLLP